MLSFVVYFETLLQYSGTWGKLTFYHFSKKCFFSVFLHIEAQLSLKNAWLPNSFLFGFQ